MDDASSRLKPFLPDELAAWLDECGGDLSSAWRQCPHAEWLIRLALAVNVDRSLVVRAATDLASAALATCAVRIPTAERAIRTARAWLDGTATASEAWASGFSAMDASDAEEDLELANAMRAAAFVAFACDEKAEATFYAHRGYAAKAAHAAELALAGPPSAADRVRAHIPAGVFLDALEIASKPPPPMNEGEADQTTDSFYA